MSTGVVAASAAAVAMYWYLFKQKGLQDGTMEPVLPLEAHRNAPDHAPSNWGEALFHVKEVLRYMYNETLGRWHTIDLFVGLAYLSHREALEYPAADIAASGNPVELGPGSSVTEQIKLILELQEARRYMLYCKGLKLRREEMQARFWREHLGADTLTIVTQQPTAGVLRPAYVVLCDHCLRAVVLCIRGTHSMKDLFTSLAGAAKPHHVVDPSSGQLVLGYSHLGMLAAARWLARQVTPVLREALAGSPPGYQLRIVGHSMGGGTAALLTMMFRGGLPGAPPHSTAGAPPPGPPAPAPGPGHSTDTSTSQNHTQHPPTAAPAPALTAADPSATAAAADSTPSAASPASGPSSDPFLSARCVAIACPSVVTLELAAACRDYVTSLVNGTDIVPTFCAASVDRLREDVTRSSWFSEFSRDMRSGVVRALQGGVRGVGSATQWTSRNILQPAVVPFRACYATTASRRFRGRRAASAAALSSVGAATAAAAAFDAAAAAAMASCPHPAQQQEQMLLAAGAGGGAAAAAAAAAAVAALEGGGGDGVLSPSSTSAALLAAAWGEPGVGLGGGVGPAAVGSVLPPGPQSMSPGGRYRGGGGAAGGSGSGVDQRAMAEAVQSCMYAVNSSVAAHHHHPHQQSGQQGGSQGRSAPDAAIAEALGLLDSLPPELERERGPGPAAAASAVAPAGPSSGRLPGHHPHHPHHHGGSHPHMHPRNLEALDAPDPWRRQSAAVGGDSGGGAATAPGPSLAADSLLASSAAAALGAGGVSTAMVYGTNLRRRLWPWGQSQGQEGSAAAGGGGGGGGFADGGLGSGPGSALGPSVVSGSGGLGFGVCGGGGGLGPTAASASGNFSSQCDQDGGAGGGGIGGAAGGPMTPPRMSAPDSPGKAKAAAAAAAPGGGGAGGGSGIAALSSTRSFGDWLWRGGGLLFTTCTAPRRVVSAGPAGLGLGSARGGGGGGGGAGVGPLLMDVGEGYDDESDPEDGGGGRARRARRRRGGGSSGGGGEEGEEEEDSGDEGTGSEGPEGSEGEDDGMEDEDEEEDGGGSAHGPGADGGGGSPSGAAAAADSEQQLQAGITAVVAAVTNQASREAAEGPRALLRDENTLAAEDVLREVREADAAAAAAAASTSAAAAAGSGVRSRRRPAQSLRRREPRSGGRPAGRARAGADADTSGQVGGADPRVMLGRESSDAGLIREDDEPLSPLGSPLGGRGDRPGLSSAEYEARLYKRRLYPAGRILHLFPAAAISGHQQRQQRQQSAEAEAAQGAGSAAGAAAACTNPLDAAAARASAAQSPHVLYEVTNPQAYSRVRLCRTMVSDHLIPAYLTALDSVLSQLEEQQQRAAREAWERELEREQQQEEEMGQQQEEEMGQQRQW
ncbi:hypothetical protein PLESTF_001630500 [Pleodorina starrii]|nr:hypothetical protein PLESTF_001630500 [Pleodorina starrii]